MDRPKDPKDPNGLIGRQFAGRYELTGILGKGGMSVVYSATHLQRGTTVALKVLARELSTEDKQIRRFTQEAQACSRLNHPHVIRVFDYGQSEDGLLFMAMEKLQGKTLAQRIRQSGPMAPRMACDLMRQVSSALEVAHSEGIIHRDLKPENVFLCDTSDGRPFLKILDFGIAKVTNETSYETLTQTGFICGTPLYISPEQSLGLKLDGRADIYSVGVMLFELLTGVTPFQADTPIALVMKHIHNEPPPLESVLPEVRVPSALRAFVYQMLSKDRHKRPENAVEMTATLESFVEGMGPVGDRVPVPTNTEASPPAETRLLERTGLQQGPARLPAGSEERLKRAPSAGGVSALPEPGVLERKGAPGTFRSLAITGDLPVPPRSPSASPGPAPARILSEPAVDPTLDPDVTFDRMAAADAPEDTVTSADELITREIDDGHETRMMPTLDAEATRPVGPGGRTSELPVRLTTAGVGAGSGGRLALAAALLLAVGGGVVLYVLSFEPLRTNTEAALAVKSVDENVADPAPIETPSAGLATEEREGIGAEQGTGELGAPSVREASALVTDTPKGDGSLPATGDGSLPAPGDGETLATTVSMGALRGPQAPSRRARNVLIDVADLSAAAPATVEVPEFRTFLVESNPTNAVVSVSGEILGKTPYRFVATAQTDDTMVVVSRDGYLPRTWHYRAGAKPPPGQDRVKLVLRRSPRHRDRGSSRRVRWEE